MKPKRAERTLWSVRNILNEPLVRYLDPDVTQYLENWLDRPLGHGVDERGYRSELVDLIEDALRDVQYKE